MNKTKREYICISVSNYRVSFAPNPVPILVPSLFISKKSFFY